MTGALCIITGGILFLVQGNSSWLSPLIVIGCVLVLAGRLLHRMRRRHRG
jgi:hypothetical protein